MIRLTDAPEPYHPRLVPASRKILPKITEGIHVPSPVKPEEQRILVASFTPESAMTSYYRTSGDRQSSPPQYDSTPVAVFPDGSVMWEQSDAGYPQSPGPPLVMPTQPSNAMRGVILGVVIALISTGFGAILPRLANGQISAPTGCSKSFSEPIVGGEENLNPPFSFSASNQCRVGR